MQNALRWPLQRRSALLLLGQMGVGFALSACASTPGPSTPAGTPAPPSAPPTPVSGAAPLPFPPPTPGGPPPTVVGASSVLNSPVAGGPSGTPSPQPAAAIMISPDPRFDPGQVSISRGQTVQWRNGSRSPQTVTDDPARVSDKSKVALPPGAEPFDSGVINPGDTFTHSFSVAGDYQYVSLPFEAQNLVGRVTVQS